MRRTTCFIASPWAKTFTGPRGCVKAYPLRCWLWVWDLEGTRQDHHVLPPGSPEEEEGPFVTPRCCQMTRHKVTYVCQVG